MRKVLAIAMYGFVGVGIIAGMIGLHTLLGQPASIRDGSGLAAARDLAIYEWRDARTVHNYETLLASIKEQGFNRVYLNINAYTDVFELPEPGRSEQIQAFAASVRQYVKAAHADNIAVDALAGDKDWATPDKQYLMLQVIDFIRTYNTQTALDEQLHGLQFDIEPYNLPEFAMDQQTVMGNYLNAIQAATDTWRQSNNASLELGFAVPFWLDGDNQYARAVQWQGVVKYPVYHLLDMLAALPHPFLVIMDYRNKAEGADGAIYHANGEIGYATKYAQNVKVVIGQEIGYVEPRKITFYGLGVNELNKQLSLLNKAYGSKQVFGGFAIHDFNGYEAFLK